MEAEKEEVSMLLKALFLLLLLHDVFQRLAFSLLLFLLRLHVLRFLLRSHLQGKAGFEFWLHLHSRAILILTFFRNHYFACSQVLPLASRFSKLFLFLLYDLSFPCRYFFSASMGISMGK